MDLNSPESLWKEWKSRPTPENLSRAVKSFDHLAMNAVGQQKSVNPALLKSKARLLTAEAIKTYDPSMGTRLSTHVYNYLRPLNRSAKDMTEIAPMSRYYGDESAKLISFVQSFAEQNGREPDDLEIRDNLGMSEVRLNKLNKAIKYEVPESQIVGGIENDAGEESERLNLWTDYVYNDLDSTSRKIMDMKLGRHGRDQMSNDEIAQKLGLSPLDVSNRAAKIAKSILDGVNTKERELYE